MNRLQFFRNLALGAVAVPAALVAVDNRPKVSPHRIAQLVADIPPEAGSVNCMALFADHVFVGCTNGLYTIKFDK